MEVPSVCGCNASHCKNAGLASDRAAEVARVIVEPWATGKAQNYQEILGASDFAMFSDVDGSSPEVSKMESGG